MRRLARALIAGPAVVALYLAGLGDLLLETPNEPREAEIAREVWINGPLHVPRLNGRPFVEKPPLTYWAASLVLGIAAQRVPGEFAVRLAPALFSLGMVFATFLIGWSWFSPAHGALAALMLASTPEVIGTGRSFLTDPALACALVGTIGAATSTLLAVRRERAVLLLVTAACGSAAAFLAKGPIAWALAVLPVAGAIVAAQGIRGLVKAPALRVLLAVSAGSAVAAALWIWIVAREGDPSLLRQIVRYHVGALTGSSREHLGSGWFYLVPVAVGFLPWTLLLAPLACEAYESRAPQPLGRRILALWALATLGLLSCIAQKRNVYALPLYPPLALLAAGVLLEPLQGRAASLARNLWRVMSPLLVAGGLLAPPAVALRAWIVGRFDLVLLGLALWIGALCVFFFARRYAEEPDAPLPGAFTAVSLQAVLALALALCIVPISHRRNRSLRPLAREVAAAVANQPDVELHGYRLTEALNGALPFEMGRVFGTLEAREDVERTLAADPRSRVILERHVFESEGLRGRILGEFKKHGLDLLLVGPEQGDPAYLAETTARKRSPD